jgi:hypothetical protein
VDYLARVDLYDVTEDEDYDKLHTAMEQRGFLRQIQDDNGVWYILPGATYVIEGTDMTMAAAHDAVVAAATQTGFEFSLIVVEFANSVWTNLEPAEPAQ